MKVLYMTVPSFFDLEISLIRELKKFVNIKVVMIVSPESMHSSAFSIDALDERCDIIPASEYRGMEKYKEMIDLDDWFIANNPDNSILHGISLSCKIRKFYKENGFELLHGTTNCKTSLFLLPFVCRQKNTVLTKHDPIQHGKVSFLYELIKCRLVHKAYKKFILLSDALSGQFCQHYSIDQDDIFFSRLSIYDFLLSYDDLGNKYGDYLLFFGRIEKYKGVDVLIEAFLKTKAFADGRKLVIAGRGNISHNVTQLPPNVIFLNQYIPNDMLANLIRHCQFVVLPYLSATQSGCAMSAFAFNKPILATDVGDLPKVVVNGKTGQICPPDDVNALALSIDEMMDEKLVEYSNTIYDLYHCEGEYSWQKIAQGIVDIYNSLFK